MEKRYVVTIHTDLDGGGFEVESDARLSDLTLALLCARIGRNTLDGTLLVEARRLFPRWTGQNRPFVDTSKPAIPVSGIEAQ